MVKILSLAADGSFAEVNPIIASTGAPDASKTVQTDAGGKLDISVLPTGVGADTQSILASEALAAGDFVNIFFSSGKSVRKASAVDNTKPANGFVLTSVSAGAYALVYMRGINDKVDKGALTTADIGKTVFLSPATSGFATATRPTTSGQVVQPLGPIVDVATTMTVNFSQQPRTVLA